MAFYKLYRHPQRVPVAIRSGDWWAGLSGQEWRLLRDGYRDVGVVDAPSALAALSRAQLQRPVQRPAARSQVLVTAGGPPAPGLRTLWLPGLIILFVGFGLLKKARDAEPVPDPLMASAPAVAALELQAAGEGESDSPWMRYEQLAVFSRTLDMGRQRVIAAEGRPDEGGQCRLRIGPAPQTAHRWYWWCAQSSARFEQLQAEYSAEGYTLAQQQAYLDDQGRSWHSAVWHQEPTR